MSSSSVIPQPTFRVPQFCPRCGSEVSCSNQESTQWTCVNGHKTYCNPVPVGVGILIAEGSVVLVRRNIDPGKGKLAFPGGNLFANETVGEGTSREVKEETGFWCDPDLWQPLDFKSATGNERILLFSIYRGFVFPTFNWKPDGHEVSEVVLVRTMPPSSQIAFPLHGQVLQQVLLNEL